MSERRTMISLVKKETGKMKLQKYHILYFFFFLIASYQTGCHSPTEYRLQANEKVEGIIREKTGHIFGQEYKLNIERPSDTLRRRLLLEQGLTHAGEASLGTDQLTPIEHWPEKNYPDTDFSIDPIVLLEIDKSLRLSLMQALEVGARNSFEYQSRKEDVFKEALVLDLERNEFRNIFVGQIENLVTSDTTGDRAQSGARNSGELGMSRKFTNGIELTTALAIDLANLMTGGGASSMGIAGDATISIPLLRGSGKYIVAEPLTQAERNVIYSIYEFERFKKTFAVNVASSYLAVLRQLDEVKNSEENYRSLITSARRSRRLADAGRIKEIEVDQANQDELRARERWIRAEESYKRSLDVFKSLLGLPPDAEVQLDRAELEKLFERASQITEKANGQQESGRNRQTPPADAPIELVEPDRDNAGPMELDESLAVRLGLDNRLDFRVTQGKVYDAQRSVVVAADALGAELTFFGSAGFGERRSITTADLDNAQFRADKARFTSLITLDLPFERTRERNVYRNSFITLERAVRDVQILEDRIKISIRNELRDMLESRESVQIQASSVKLAQKRVTSTNLFLEAGRAQIRDLLESQEALLSAQNALTAAIINYRVAEWEIQRDMGVLKIDEKGLWKEFSGEEQIQ